MGGKLAGARPSAVCIEHQDVIETAPVPRGIDRAATSQDVLDFCARNCNLGEIAKESAHVLTCAKVAFETALPRDNVLLRKSYDHGLRDLTCEECDPKLFHHLGVPRATAASWIRRGQRPVVSAEVIAMDQLELQADVIALQRRVKFLMAMIEALWRSMKKEPAVLERTPPGFDDGIRETHLNLGEHAVNQRSCNGFICRLTPGPARALTVPIRPRKRRSRKVGATFAKRISPKLTFPCRTSSPRYPSSPLPSAAARH